MQDLIPALQYKSTGKYDFLKMNQFRLSLERLVFIFHFRPPSPYLCASRCANLICTRTHAFAFPVVVTPDLTWHDIIYDSHVTFIVSTAFKQHTAFACVHRVLLEHSFYPSCFPTTSFQM